MHTIPSGMFAGAVVSEAADEVVRSPLWLFPPFSRLALLSERRRRNILQHDPEPIGDPEYT